MQIHLKEKTWNWHAHTITLFELWGSDVMFRLEIQTWCSDLKFRLDVNQDLSSDLGNFNPGLKIENSPGLFLENLQSRIEAWRFSRTLLGESSIQDWSLKILQDSSWRIFNLQDWRLKILQDSSWGIFNPGLKIENWRFSRTLLGESSSQDWRLKIENSPGLFLENLPSKTEDSILKVLSWIEDSPRRVPGDFKSSILDWRFSGLFLENLQSSILVCSQALRGIRRCLKMRRCHRLRSLRRARQLSESSSLRLKSQCVFKSALKGIPCSLKEQKKCAALKGCGGFYCMLID